MQRSQADCDEDDSLSSSLLPVGSSLSRSPKLFQLQIAKFNDLINLFEIRAASNISTTTYTI